MLSIVSAYAHCARIAITNFNIDVAHGRIEGTRAGVTRRGICPRTAAREKHHVSGALLETWRVCGQHEPGPLRAKPDQADSRPDIDGLGQTVATRGNEKNALVGCLLNLVDGLL
jgi:hypothetical protein